MYNNKTKFVEPLTRRLKDHSQKIKCTLLSPPLWKISNQWFALTPEIVHVATPQKWDTIGSLSLMTPTGVYTSSGLYPAKEVNKMLESHITPRLREAYSYSETSETNYDSAGSANIWKSLSKNLPLPNNLGMVTVIGQFLIYSSFIVSTLIGLYLLGVLFKISNLIQKVLRSCSRTPTEPGERSGIPLNQPAASSAPSDDRFKKSYP